MNGEERPEGFRRVAAALEHATVLLAQKRTTAQRRRELAVLRAAGATGGQIRRLVLADMLYFDDKLREFGYWSGAAYGCVPEARLSVEDGVKKVFAYCTDTEHFAVPDIRDRHLPHFNRAVPRKVRASHRGHRGTRACSWLCVTPA
mgnify:CR=1 FL=1